MKSDVMLLNRLQVGMCGGSVVKFDTNKLALVYDCTLRFEALRKNNCCCSDQGGTSYYSRDRSLCCGMYLTLSNPQQQQ